MSNQDQPVNVMRDYFGIDQKNFLKFCGMVVGVITSVTLLYSLIFGFDTWTNNMSQAGSLLLANTDPALPGGPVPLATPLPPPVYGQVMPAALPPPRPSPAATYYTCPRCGTVGLPSWSPHGAPQCPNCGTIMTATGQRAFAGQAPNGFGGFGP